MFKKMFANCLLVNDFDKSLAFYRDILGLELNTQEGKFANFKVENIELAIMQKENTKELVPAEYLNNGGSVFLCFQVDDVNLAYETLKKKGVSFITSPKVTSWGQVVAYFQDPDNNIWEISKK